MENRTFENLRESYRRGIETSLTFLDETLCLFEEWARGREVRSVLYTENNGLSPSQRQKIIAEVVSIKAVLRELKDVFGLEQRVETAAKSIWSNCSGLWATLAEMESKRMRGYGEPPEGFPHYWDPKLEEIQQHLARILDVLKED